MKTLMIFASALMIAGACTSVEIPGRDVTDYSDGSDGGELALSDRSATAETKALYQNLWDITEKGFMFGHHDDLMYGRYWYGEAGKSDTKAVCGDYPAVYSLDFSEIVDDRFDADPETNALRLKCVKEAYDRGMVIVVCAHLDNPKTGGDAWDNTSNKVVSEILDESTGTHRF